MKELALKVPGMGGTPTVQIQAPDGIPSNINIISIVRLSLTIAMIIGILLALFYLIYGGIFWIQASGDKQKWDKARRIVVYSLIGLIVMSIALVLVNVIASAIGVKNLIY